MIKKFLMNFKLEELILRLIVAALVLNSAYDYIFTRIHISDLEYRQSVTEIIYDHHVRTSVAVTKEVTQILGVMASAIKTNNERLVSLHKALGLIESRLGLTSARANQNQQQIETDRSRELKTLETMSKRQGDLERRLESLELRMQIREKGR